MDQFTAPRTGQPAPPPTVRRGRSSKKLLLALAAAIQLVTMAFVGVGPATATAPPPGPVFEWPDQPFELSLYCDRHDSPILSWDAVPGARSYEVQTSYVERNARPLPYWTEFRTDHVRYNYGTTTRVGLPCYHPHEFRVRAIGADGSLVATSTIIGTGSSQISSTFPEPRNVRPAWTNDPWGGGAFDRLTWASVPGAEGYNVYNATTNRYLTTVRTTSFDPFFPGDFYVTAFDGNGNFSTRSNTATIDTVSGL